MPRDSIKGDKNPNYRTGLAMKGDNAGIYNSWQNMKQRCNNPKHPKYSNYGGRGITVCPEWLNIVTFKKWALEHGYKPGLTVDRIDNDKGYSPDNCRWVSVSENSRKKSSTKIKPGQADVIRKRLADGECAYALADEYGVQHGTIWYIQNNITHVGAGKCVKAIKAIRERNLEARQ